MSNAREEYIFAILTRTTESDLRTNYEGQLVESLSIWKAGEPDLRIKSVKIEKSIFSAPDFFTHFRRDNKTKGTRE